MVNRSLSTEQDLAYALRCYLDDHNELGMSFELLKQTADLAAFPIELLKLMTLAPSLYNPGRRRFEFQRTPNKYPAGQITFAGQGVTSIRAAVAAASRVALDLVPSDGAMWRVIGGVFNSSAPCNLQLRQEGGTKSITQLALLTNTPTPMPMIGNGVELDNGKVPEIAVDAAAVIIFQLFVSEESDTIGRGGA